ncbi:MAG: ArsR family transcriptional regulator [Mariniphaga sp.]|nr:ArsR family transcriptional regulator [Mariniphaga sp.]
MLGALISSRTRLKLLIKFFLFDGNKGYLRKMEKEFNESTNAIRLELNRFVEAGLLTSEYEGRRRYYRANTRHPLYYDLQRIVLKMVGIDQIIERVTSQIGDLEEAYIIGDFALGVDTEVIELALVGEQLDISYINQLMEKAEKMIERKIMYQVLTSDQMAWFFKDKPSLLIWKDED